jgi:hypothetical protein
MNATEAKIKHRERPDAGMRHLFEELNREDSALRPHLLDAALAGLRLTRTPSSRALRCDAAEVWSVIEPVIHSHLHRRWCDAVVDRPPCPPVAAGFAPRSPMPLEAEEADERDREGPLRERERCSGHPGRAGVVRFGGMPRRCHRC